MRDHSSREAATPVPEAVAYVRDLFLDFRPAWFLCGGWAADAWLGRQTRDHCDVDIAVFHPDQHAIFEHSTSPPTSTSPSSEAPCPPRQP
ncbi:nucleotidyltransferase domain-containing protein [Nonomuraea sp. MTCD27]|uniref:nucleotidyltransferase domain-containing protein n=1 Tax=Nonomuraea sp. MTCD27 TaxID=1676747 RepID=UPI0035C2266E